jgi:hypothetical protein
MDHYEELGLSRTATMQEIRHAYKVMARLVHPDGQSVELREMAERQIKRLNQILATFTNEQNRREYDTGLTVAMGLAVSGPIGANAVSPRQLTRTSGMPRPLRWWRRPRPWQPQADSWLLGLPAWVRPVAENWFWISLALVPLCVGVWYLAQDQAEPASFAVVTPVPDIKTAPLRGTTAAILECELRRE